MIRIPQLRPRREENWPDFYLHSVLGSLNAAAIFELLKVTNKEQIIISQLTETNEWAPYPLIVLIRTSSFRKYSEKVTTPRLAKFTISLTNADTPSSRSSLNPPKSFARPLMRSSFWRWCKIQESPGYWLSDLDILLLYAAHSQKWQLLVGHHNGPLLEQFVVGDQGKEKDSYFLQQGGDSALRQLHDSLFGQNAKKGLCA